MINIGLGINRTMAPRLNVPGSYLTGDQSALITVTGSVSLITGTPGTWVNGVTSGETTTYFANGITVDATQFVEFALSTSKRFTEVKFYQSAPATHGVWKWQGWNGSAWVDIGSSFTLGGTTVQTIQTMNANAASYTKYRINGVSGLTSGVPYVCEFQFRAV